MGWGSIGKIINKVDGALGIGGALGSLGLSANPFVNALNKSMARSRADQNADAESLREANMTAQQLGDSEMEKYKSGELTADQQAAIDAKTGIEKAQLKQAFSSMGISDSSMMAMEKSNIAADATGMQESVAEQHWDAAMKAYGLSDTAQDMIHKTNIQQRMENIQIYAGLMNVIGQGAGAWAGTPDSTQLEDVSATAPG